MQDSRTDFRQWTLSNLGAFGKMHSWEWALSVVDHFERKQEIASFPDSSPGTAIIDWGKFGHQDRRGNL